VTLASITPSPPGHTHNSPRTASDLERSQSATNGTRLRTVITRLTSNGLIANGRHLRSETRPRTVTNSPRTAHDRERSPSASNGTRPRTVTDSPRTAHDRERSLPASNAIDRERSWLTDYENRPRTVTIRLERHLVANDHHLPRTAVDRERSHLIIRRERHRPLTVLFDLMPRTARTANGPDSPQAAYDPERSKHGFIRSTAHGRTSPRMTRSRTIVI
jgi:hypothetical protein